MWQEFYYDETSPSFLRWARDSYSGNGKLQVARGDIAGSLKPNGRWEVYAEGRLQQVHRIIYEIFNGKIPEGLLVDHEDGNPSNNRINNLRVADYILNSRNRKKSTVNTSGATGVHWLETVSSGGSKNLYACAAVQVLKGYKKITKQFSVKRMGLLESFAAACSWRENQLSILNTEGAGYSERHGICNE